MAVAAQHVDLHAHSTASDGSLTPSELVRHMAAAGVRILALTDHDSTDGLEEAQCAARELAITLVPGVELSVTWQRRTLHVLGLGIDPAAPALRQGLERLQEVRRQRAGRMVAKLQAIGISDAAPRLEQLARAGQVTRTHVARLLVEAGRCRNEEKAYRRYLRPGGAVHVTVTWAGLEEALAWIRAAGGLGVLAHPYRYGLGTAVRERLFETFRTAGGVGIEVSSGAPDPGRVAIACREALRHGLLGSVGSDFHHPGQTWLRLGAQPSVPAPLQPLWSELQLG